MITRNNIMESTDKEWLRSLLMTEVPAVVRLVARRLYALGEKELGLATIIEQMNRYKDPNTHRNIKIETCPAAARELGWIGNTKAIPDLIEAMDVYPLDAAFALSLINGEELSKNLHELSKIGGIKGFSATFALGYMKDLNVLPSIIDIIRHAQSYLEKYLPHLNSEAGLLYFVNQAMYILGNYDNHEAEQLFLERLTKDNIRWFIFNYAFEEDTQAYTERTDISTLGWRIVKKFGWDTYLINPETIKMLINGNRTKWEKEEKALVDLIWENVQKNLEITK